MRNIVKIFMYLYKKNLQLNCKQLKVALNKRWRELSYSIFYVNFFFILINKFQSILLYNNLYHICFKIDPLEIF